jgi:hypothetical protein
MKLRLAVRDPSKIPETRAMEFGSTMFLLTITVHDDPEAASEGADGDEPGDDNNNSVKPGDGGKENEGNSKLERYGQEYGY